MDAAGSKGNVAALGGQEEQLSGGKNMTVQVKTLLTLTIHPS
jgi:hypothetical protein